MWTVWTVWTTWLPTPDADLEWLPTPELVPDPRLTPPVRRPRVGSKAALPRLAHDPCLLPPGSRWRVTTETAVYVVDMAAMTSTRTDARTGLPDPPKRVVEVLNAVVGDRSSSSTSLTACARSGPHRAP